MYHDVYADLAIIAPAITSKLNLNFMLSKDTNTTLEFHPSGKICFMISRGLLNEIIVGEITVRSPYDVCCNDDWYACVCITVLHGTL